MNATRIAIATAALSALAVISCTESTESSSSGSDTTYPDSLNPPKGADPIRCGTAGECFWKDGSGTTLAGCQCGGAGNGLQSAIICPTWYPCRYYVWGAYRCYAVDASTGQCH